MYKSTYLGNIWINLPLKFTCLIYARLQAELTRLNVEIHRRVFSHITDAFRAYPETTAFFNCTGIGALTLGGVEDTKIFAARVRIDLTSQERL